MLDRGSQLVQRARRNPKAETRRPKEGRNPKSEKRRCHYRSNLLLEGRPHQMLLRHLADHSYGVENSAFGLRASGLRLRASDLIQQPAAP